jgi:AraC-like DNA-binding protein
MLGTFRNWVEIVRRTLDGEGISLDAELSTRGLPIGEVEPHEGRLAPSTTRAIWHVVEERSHDPVFGLSMLRRVDYLDFEELGVALVASGDAEAVLERIVRYHSLISDRVSIALDTGARLLEVRVGHLDHWRASEFSAGLIAGVLRDRFDASVRPTEVHLEFDNPLGGDIYRRFFRCPIFTGAAVTRLTYDRTVLARHRLREPVGVSDRFEQVLRNRELELTSQGSTVDAVRRALIEMIGTDPPSLGRVAASMHVSERTLQRRLRDEGESFAVILDDSRRELARTWLAEGRLSRTEIAYLLGFSQPSSFSRARRRWGQEA